MLHVITSGDLTTLWQTFETKLRENPNSNLLEPDIIIVPNRDIGRWIQVKRTTESGISANLEFVLPANFIHRLNLAADKNYESKLPDKFRLGWMIYAELAADINGEQYPDLNQYISKQKGDESGALSLRRFQLAVKTADIYDQYQLFRPDWISSWNRGEQPEELRDIKTAHWQMQLWNNIRKAHPEMTDRAALHQKLLGNIESGNITLPKNLHVFMTGAVPPVYNEALIALGKQSNVFCYRVMATEPNSATGAKDSNPLFIQLGEEQRDSEILFREGVSKTGVQAVPEKGGQFIGETEKNLSLIRQIQHDIHTAKTSPLPVDDSIRVHACHNPTREIEVLQDEIIDFLENHPDAGPSDILVVAPQLSDHITAVHAVFGHPASDKLRLPYHIHDPSTSVTSRLFELLKSLMTVDRIRFKAATLMELIDSEPIRERFALTADDISLIEHWLKETGVRWGLDGSYRNDSGIFSWDFGLSRLLMGIMQPLERDEPIMGVMPYADIEGAGQLRVAGVLIGIFEKLKHWSEFSKLDHSVPEWQTEIRNLTESFFPQDSDTQRAQLPLDRAIERLRDASSFIGEQANLSLNLVYDAINEQIKERTAGSGYRTGGITFSAMVPVRHLPFRFIAVLGMNENSFPGREQASGFDLMLQKARKGDRQKRINNRALFLDALLTASERLHLSYVGFSFKDGADIAPSLVVRELMDYIKSHSKDDKKASQIQLRHRLHGFHEDYLKESEKGLFTYDESRAGIQRQIRAGLHDDDARKRFDIRPEPPELQDDNIIIEISSLIAMLKHPVRAVMESRARMKRISTEELQDERDIFNLDGLGSYNLNQELLDILITNKDYLEEGTGAFEELEEKFRLKGWLPYEQAGKTAMRIGLGNAVSFVKEVEEQAGPLTNPLPEIHAVNLRIGGKNVLVRGQIPPAENGRAVVVHYAEAKAKRKAEVWVGHLLRAASSKEELTTVYASWDKKKGEAVLQKVRTDKPAERLRELVEYYLAQDLIGLPATASALEKLYELLVATDPKKQTKTLTSFKSYFDNPDSEWSFDTLKNEDPYAFMLFGEYEDEIKELMLPLAEQIWQPLEKGFEKFEVVK